MARLLKKDEEIPEEGRPKSLSKMTRKDFEALPEREHWDGQAGPFTELVLLPMRTRHDSGYRCIEVIGCVNGEAICRLAGTSDVLCVDGIGGYGKDWLNKYDGVPVLIPPSGWMMDCLPTSGLFRIFSIGNKRIMVGAALSSFEFYSVEVGDNE